MAEPHVLVGKKDICKWLERSWATVREWIVHHGLPVAKIDGIYEADPDQLRAWRKARILAEAQAAAARNGKGGPGPGQTES